MMDCIFRKHIVFEMIDKETGEVIYREVSKSKEFDSVAEMLGYDGAADTLSKLAVNDELVTYDDDGFPNEPEVRTQELSETVKKVVYEDTATEPDAIFADMEVPEVEDTDASSLEDNVLASIDTDTLTESLTGNTDEVNEFGEVSDMSLDLEDDDGKEEKRYSVDEFIESDDNTDNNDESDVTSDAVIDLSGILAFDEDDTDSVSTEDDASVTDEDIEVTEEEEDLPFASEEEEESFKTRINRLNIDNLFD